MEVCKFLLAVSLAVTGGGGAAEPHVGLHSPKVVESTRIAGGRLWTRSAGQRGTSVADGHVLALSQGIWDADSGALSEADVADRLLRAGGLRAVAAPCALSMVDGRGELSVSTDHVGLRHVYGVRGPGWSAVSTSATELARLANNGLDTDALGEYRLIGHYLETSTAFRGVVKLAPGHIWRLANGVLRTEAYAADPSGGPAATVDGVDTAVPRHATRLRHLVTSFLDSYPDAVLELSGGLDSRMVLAAVPPRRRVGLRAITISHAGSLDGPVAAGLAARYGLAHQVVDLAGLVALHPEVAYRMAKAASVRSDSLGSPLSLAVLDWVEGHVEPGPRLGGHGGELTRSCPGCGWGPGCGRSPWPGQSP